MGIKVLENGEQFRVGDKTYRVVDDELYEVKLEKVSEDTEPYRWYPVYPSYPDCWPYTYPQPWYTTTTSSSIKLGG